MTYVIAEPCIGVKDRSCVDVCPVECIDCGACVPECPVTAIFTEEDGPPDWGSYIAKNRDIFKSANPPGGPKR